MILQKLIIYGFVLNLAFAPLFANTPSSKGSLSPEDIEKIADCVIEKLQAKQNDPEYRQKMLENHIAFQSSPEMQEFRREQMIKESSHPKVQEARKKQMQKDLNENIELKTYMNRSIIIKGAAIAVFAFGIGFIIGKT